MIDAKELWNTINNTLLEIPLVQKWLLRGLKLDLICPVHGRALLKDPVIIEVPGKTPIYTMGKPNPRAFVGRSERMPRTVVWIHTKHPIEIIPSCSIGRCDPLRENTALIIEEDQEYILETIYKIYTGDCYITHKRFEK